MKYGLLVGKTLSNGKYDGIKNIGDYIQNLAALQYLPQVDEYIDREGDNTGNDKLKLIMNAWYSWNPDKFPIEERYIPLPISMHLSPSIADDLLKNTKVKEWFHKYEPIGCRDYGTKSFLEKNNIKAYFSGCLTLTLGKTYKNPETSGELIFVDPYIGMARKELNFLECINCVTYALMHFQSFICVSKKFKHKLCDDNATHRRLFYSTVFLKTYSKLFSLKQLREGIYISHHVKVGKGTNLQTEDEKLEYAKELVRKYAKAKLVVTSRIHCALPCLGIETPVLFTIGDSIEKNSPKADAGRFGGLINLFNVVTVDKITIKNSVDVNKDDYRTLANKMDARCEEFIADNFGDTEK
mgnify:CR=1 FL=1